MSTLPSTVEQYEAVMLQKKKKKYGVLKLPAKDFA